MHLARVAIYGRTIAEIDEVGLISYTGQALSGLLRDDAVILQVPLPTFWMPVYTIDLFHVPARVTALALRYIPLAVGIATLRGPPAFPAALVETRNGALCTRKALPLLTTIATIPETTIAFIYLYTTLTAGLYELGISFAFAWPNLTSLHLLPCTAIVALPLFPYASGRPATAGLRAAVTTTVHHVTGLALPRVLALPISAHRAAKTAGHGLGVLARIASTLSPNSILSTHILSFDATTAVALSQCTRFTNAAPGDSTYTDD